MPSFHSWLAASPFSAVEKNLLSLVFVSFFSGFSFFFFFSLGGFNFCFTLNSLSVISFYSSGFTVADITSLTEVGLRSSSATVSVLSGMCPLDITGSYYPASSGRILIQKSKMKSILLSNSFYHHLPDLLSELVLDHIHLFATFLTLTRCFLAYLPSSCLNLRQ